MSDEFISAVENLVRKAPAAWLESACAALRSQPATATSSLVLQRLPSTNNADLPFLAAEVLRFAVGRMSWEAVSWAIHAAAAIHRRSQRDRYVELLWSGPAPGIQIPARRIDQALYDLIANAEREILLVTFAAAKIGRLTDVLLAATGRGVRTRLILEFEHSSEGQLSYDALKAFPPTLIDSAEVYHWPVEKRERNQAGRPGKLHAKVAVVDDVSLVSSANLTDDAFNRNLEIGVMLRSDQFRAALAEHLLGLIHCGCLLQIESPGKGPGRT